MRARRLFADLVANLAVLLVLALLFEGILRVLYAHSLDFDMEMWKYAARLKHSVDNPKLSFVHVPNGHEFLMGVDVRTNSQGLRDNEYSLTKAPGIYRIMMLGDSTTLGWGVPLKDTAAKVLERALNESHVPGHQRFEVINAGVGNYDTVQEVAYYQTRGKSFHPDLVILVYFINDPEPVPKENKGLLVDRSYLVAFLVSRFRALQGMMGRRPDWKAYYHSLYDETRPGYQACKTALKDLADTTRDDGAEVLVALLPELRHINGNYPFAEEHQRIKDVLKPEGVPVVDLINGLRDHGPESTLWVTPSDDHPNSKANALVAAQLQDWIVRNLTEARKKRKP